MPATSPASPSRWMVGNLASSERRRPMSAHRSSFRCALVAALSFLAMPAAADPLRDAVAKDLPSLMAIYRDLHTHPELSFQEKATAAKLAAEAKKLGFEVTTG